MADIDLQELLDPGATARGITIKQRVDAGSLSSYYLEGNVTGVGKAMWVNVTTADSDAQKNTAIRAAFGVA
jgi:hypothetical protein